nr:AraC family transcriptional regulator [uncultured Mediterraneibacter sp.]
MTEHPERRYTIESLSKEYLINTATLKRVFKSVYGMPVASYMKQYRMTKAAELLSESDASIASVARSVGYESQSKFSAAFKDIMKILPTDYRRQYRESS